MLTHRAIATNVLQREVFLAVQAGDRFLCMMPLFHSFALAMNLYQALVCAGALVILPRYRPDWVISALAEERINVLPAGATVSPGCCGMMDWRVPIYGRYGCATPARPSAGGNPAPVVGHDR